MKSADTHGYLAKLPWISFKKRHKRLLQQLHLILGSSIQDCLHTGKELENTGNPKTVEDLGAAFVVVDDTHVLQDREVFGDGRDIRSDHFRQLAHAALAA
jgi:hypothetical protein